MAILRVVLLWDSKVGKEKFIEICEKRKSQISFVDARIACQYLDDLIEAEKDTFLNFERFIPKFFLETWLPEIDKRAIDESYHLTLCPIAPAHDIHILPKNGRLFFCHLVKCKLSPVFEEAKKLLLSGAAFMVHVYRGCAFVINNDGEVTKRIDTVDEPMNLVIRNGW